MGPPGSRREPFSGLADYRSCHHPSGLLGDPEFFCGPAQIAQTEFWCKAARGDHNFRLSVVSSGCVDGEAGGGYLTHGVPSVKYAKTGTIIPKSAPTTVDKTKWRGAERFQQARRAANTN